MLDNVTARGDKVRKASESTGKERRSGFEEGAGGDSDQIEGRRALNW